MERLAEHATDTYLRVVDIVRWDSAVAEQYQIGVLPTLGLFADGKLVSQDTDEILGRLER